MRNSGEQVRYRMRNLYKRVRNPSHAIMCVVITMRAICHTRTHFFLIWTGIYY